MFHGSVASAGFAHGTALTATGLLSLMNPAGSGVNLEVLKVTLGFVSGTLGAGTLWWVKAANPTSNPSEDATKAVRSAGLVTGSPNDAGSKAKIYSNVSMTNVPVIVRPTCISYAPLVIGTTAVALPALVEETDGSIVIPPGYWAGIQGIGSGGSSPLVIVGIEWQEVPV